MSRFEKNFKILELIHNAIDLKEYTGFGGLNKVMNRDHYLKLKSILNDSDFQQLLESTKTAYFTPNNLIQFIYSVLEKIGFTGGRILEPSCGHGAFLFNMPEMLIKNSQVFAIELNRLSARISRLINPFVKIANAGFEQTKFDNSSFDLIIGNPPFGSQKIKDSNPDLNNMAIHHYFVSKSIMLLKSGGILAMVLPQYCLDNLKDHPRKIMNDHGSLIAAYRLPDCMFDNAKVTVDIVFYIKKKINNIPFLNLKPVTVNGHSLVINEYFKNNPSHIIGNLNTCNMYNERIGLTVSSSEDKSIIYNKLITLIDHLEPIYQSNNDSRPNVLALLDQTILRLQQKLNNKPTIESELLKFEMEKLNYLKNKFIEHEKNEKALLNSLDITLTSLKHIGVTQHDNK